MADSLKAALEATFRGDRGDFLLAYAGGLMLEVARSGRVPNAEFKEIVEALDDQRTQIIEDGWRVVDLIDEHWDALTDDQRSAATHRLRKVFGSSPHEMFQFRIVEVLASRDEIGRTEEWLLHNARHNSGTTLASLIHGIDVILTRLPVLAPSRASLLRAVNDALESENEDVRREAAVALEHEEMRGI